MKLTGEGQNTVIQKGALSVARAHQPRDAIELRQYDDELSACSSNAG